MLADNKTGIVVWVLLWVLLGSFTVQAAVPVITQGASSEVTMDEDSSPLAFSLTLDATDADLHTLNWSISSAATQGTATASGTGTSKVIGYTPSTNSNGSDIFIVQVSDGVEFAIHVVSVTITPQNDNPTGTVVVSGTATEDQVLSVSNSLADVDGIGVISYQWQRDGADITGATGDSYTLGDDDVDALVSALASYTDNDSTSESVSSSSVGPVVNVNDLPGGAVDIDNTTPSEGDTLNASNTLTDADGMGSVSYQWQRGGSDISGEITASYTTVQADVDFAISVVASYTDLQGTAESVTSQATTLVVNVNNPPTGSVTISGIATEDQILSASNTLADIDGMGTVSYQWQRDSSDIIDANGENYTLGDDDVGSTITVVASYTDGGGTSESVSSSSVGPIININDLPSGSVNIDNTTPNEGDTLNASNTLIDADGVGSVSYQWQRGGSDISGATGTAYTTVQADVGLTISVVASYTDLQGTAESVSSAATALVGNVNNPPEGALVIDNTTPSEGDTLNASNTLTDVDGMGSVSYQWQRGGSDISGATGAAYTTVQADVGFAISVVASYSDLQGTAESVPSAATSLVGNVNNPPTGSVTIGGIATEDQILSASNTLADIDGMGAVSYQWQRDSADITDATGDSYTLVDDDVDTLITVLASYVDGGSTSESVSSSSVGPIINVNDLPSGAVNIDNITPAEGDILTASNSLTDADGMGTVSYQWQRGASDISGETNASYTTVQADVGLAISVVASYTDLQGTAESVSSAATSLVDNVNNPPTGTVIIGGIVTEDLVLNVSNSLADIDGLGALSYQWQRDSADITDATGDSYTLGDDDVGTLITVLVSYVDGGGTSESVGSSGVGPVVNINDLPGGTVNIDNTTPAEGDILTASNSLTDADGMGTVSYQWQRGASDISGETNASYTTVQADVGLAISVVASYIDLQGTAESVSSAATSLVDNVNNAPVGGVSISGAPTEDQVLNAANTLSDVDGMGTVGYQWQRDSVDIAGATGASYTLGDDDVGAIITVIASYTDGEGTNEAVSSGGAGPILNVNDLPVGTVNIDNATPSEGDTLTASNSLTDADGMGTVIYQWRRSGVNISGATGTVYTTVQLDVGSAISVVGSYTDARGIAESVISEATSAVTNVNDSPVITNTPNASALINILYSFIPVVEDPDPADTKSFTHNATLPAWLSFNSVTGELSGIPTLSDVGTTVSGILTVTDAAAATGTVSFNITIIGENSSPTMSGSPLTSIAEDAVYSFMVASTDPDIGDTATYFLQNNPTWMSINEVTGMVNGLPLNSDVGTTDNIIVGVRDSVGAEDSLTFSVLVTNTNDAPVITSTAGTAAAEDVLYSYTFTASDIDVVDTLTYSAPTLPGWLNFDASRQLLSGTPGDDEQGAYSVTLRVNDGTVAVDQSFTVSVTGFNDPPTISGTPDTIISEGSPYSFTPGASDPDMGSTLSFSIINPPGWASFDTSTGELSGTPLAVDVGSTSGIVIGVSDGIVTVNLPAFDLSVIDDNPPVVTAPADITVNASGLFTQVDFGVATAVDTLDGNLLATPDLDIYRSPGHHVVTWSATDLAGNTGTATQIVNIIPLVELATRQVSAEGSSGTVLLALNGPAVNYPVTVPFTVSGTATPGTDHNFTNGVFSISEGTEASVSFNVLADSLTEGTETIIITLGEASNAVVGVQVTHTIELMETNVAPRVSLSADQGDGQTHIVSQADGVVTVTAIISDPNSDDTQSYDWSATDNSLVDNDGVINNGVFIFDPAAVVRGVYRLRVVVNDGRANGVAELMLNVVAKAPQLSLTSDSDNDGVADAVEGFGDFDNDGIADYLDAIDARNVLQGQAADQYLMEAETGLRLTLGGVAFQAGASQAGVSVADVSNFGNAGNAPVDEMNNLGGLFDFIVSDLPAVGGSVRVVLPQLTEIPDNAIYRKLLPMGWEDFKEDRKNSLSSAPGLQGYCPPPGDAAYTPDLTPGHWCVQLYIEDGGENDADGLANQRIVDPGGVAQALESENETVTVQVNSSGGAWHPLMLVLALFLRGIGLRNKDIKK